LKIPPSPGGQGSVYRTEPIYCKGEVLEKGNIKRCKLDIKKSRKRKEKLTVDKKKLYIKNCERG
jgi:hypothetical protein